MKKVALFASILALALTASAQTWNPAGCAASDAGKSKGQIALSPTAPTKPPQDPPPPRMTDGGSVIPTM